MRNGHSQIGTKGNKYIILILNQDLVKWYPSSVWSFQRLPDKGVFDILLKVQLPVSNCLDQTLSISQGQRSNRDVDSVENIKIYDYAIKD